MVCGGSEHVPLPHPSLRLPNNKGTGKELSSGLSMSSWRAGSVSGLSPSLPEQSVSERRHLPPDRGHRDQHLRLPDGLCWAVLQHW